MGTWGSGIMQNDITADIWAEFQHYYNEGMSTQEIRELLEKEYHPETDPEYFGEIWTGIAHGQWMAGELENYTLSKVQEAVDASKLILYEDQTELRQRIRVLNSFIAKIQIPRPTPLKRKKITRRPAYFKKGDIIGIKVDEQYKLAGLVIEQDKNPIDGGNKIVLSDLIYQTKPSMKEILDAGVLYLDIGGKSNYYNGYFWAIFSARNMSRKIQDTEMLYETELDEYLSLGVGIPFGDWNLISDLYFEQEDFLSRNSSRKPYEVSIADLFRQDEELAKKLAEWDNFLFKEKLQQHSVK